MHGLGSTILVPMTLKGIDVIGTFPYFFEIKTGLFSPKMGEGE